MVSLDNKGRQSGPCVKEMVEMTKLSDTTAHGIFHDHVGMQNGFPNPFDGSEATLCWVF